MINYPDKIPCTYYPFLFPLILLGPIYFFGVNFIILHLLMLIFSLVYLISTFRVLRIFTSEKTALILLGFVGFSLVVFDQTFKIMTEIPFSIFTLCALIHLERYCRDERVATQNLFFLSLYSLLAYFTRHIGITLYATGVVFIFLASGPHNWRLRLKKVLSFSCLFLIPFLLWNLRAHLIHSRIGGMSHSSQFFLIDPAYPARGALNLYWFMVRFAHNSQHYVSQLGKQLVPYVRNTCWLTALGASVFAGCLLKIRKQLRGYDLFFVVYLCAILLWPFQEGARFLLPIFFIAVYYFYFLLKSLFANKESLVRLVLIGHLVFFVGYNFYATRKYVHTAHHPLIENFLSLHEYLKENTESDALVCSVKPSVTYLYAKRRAFIYPLTKNPQFIWQALRMQGARYLLVDEFSYSTMDYLPAFLAAYSSKLELVYKKGESAVFEIKD